MLGYLNSGFSVDAGVCIQAHDRAALVRLLCYCARTPFAMERLRKEGAALVPLPRTHRHRYFGVLAPNSPHRASVTARLGWRRWAKRSHPRPRRCHPNVHRRTTCRQC